MENAQKPIENHNQILSQSQIIQKMKVKFPELEQEDYLEFANILLGEGNMRKQEKMAALLCE